MCSLCLSWIKAKYRSSISSLSSGSLAAIQAHWSGSSIYRLLSTRHLYWRSKVLHRITIRCLRMKSRGAQPSHRFTAKSTLVTCGIKTRSFLPIKQRYVRSSSDVELFMCSHFTFHVFTFLYFAAIFVMQICVTHERFFTKEKKYWIREYKIDTKINTKMTSEIMGFIQLFGKPTWEKVHTQKTWLFSALNSWDMGFWSSNCFIPEVRNRN